MQLGVGVIGVNRADPLEKMIAEVEALLRKAQREPSAPCIFISHQREDTEVCEPIAEYLMNADLDVYFDKYDETLTQLVREGNPNKVTQRIQDGIDKSTHMLSVVSTKTVQSYWVPFEIGYGYARIPLAVLTLKGVRDESLPDYMKTTRVIRGTRSLNELIAELLKQKSHILEERRVIKKHSLLNHLLDNVLDWEK